MAKIPFTAKRVREYSCASGRGQSFLWDSTAPGLGLRATKTGGKAYVFQGRLGTRTLRVTIGSPDSWPLGEAQSKARELQRLIDQGIDPREVKRKALAEREMQVARERTEALAVGEVWQVYLEARKPRWGVRHLQDHQKLAKGPGEDKFGKPTVPGVLYVFMDMRLVDVTPEFVLEWAEKEEKVRGTQAQLGWRLLSAFFNWCSEQKEYSELVPNNPVRRKAAREVLGRQEAKQDVLLKQQLPAFFDAVQGLSNPVAATYILVLLLTGARPSELLALQWRDINFRWKSLTIRDKDESKGGRDGKRVIPLTPFVHYLLLGMPKKNQWVFAGEAKGKHIRSPHERLAEAAHVADVTGITFQGLRRSFGSLSEWLELPAGVIAQIQGHKPSATREKHYIIRPLDLLRIHHERLEGWILEQACVCWERDVKKGSKPWRVIAEKT